MPHQPNLERLTVRDPNLPFLAARAAIELDNIIRGASGETASIQALASALKTSTADVAGGGQLSLLDPGTVDALRQAMSRAVPEPITSMGVLVRSARDLADSLQSSGTAEGAAPLALLRDFCIALSQAASSYLQTAFERSRPNHPLRI